MVTKEYCIAKKFVDEMFRDNTKEILTRALGYYNRGQESYRMRLFPNTEYGLNTALKGINPYDIVNMFTNEEEESEYDRNDPAIMLDLYPFRSVSESELEEILTPEWCIRAFGNDMYEYLDDSDCADAFEYYLDVNKIDKSGWDYEWEDEHLYNVDWENVSFEELAKTLEGGQQAPTGPADEGMVFEMTEEELKKFVSESAIAAYNKLKEGKSGIHIDPKNKGKFNATKERTGKSTEELTHSKNPLTRKRANFARMAKRGWKPLKNKD